METIKFLLFTRLKRSQPTGKAAGFTLIELLVALIMAALIITPLLGFMINILSTDRREQAKATSEQEIQAAADYITRDLQQAVYIYDAQALNNDLDLKDGTTSGIKDQLPSVDDGTPVLAFWKRELIKNVVPYQESASCPGECNDAFAYSLVAYYLIQGDDPSNPNWSNAARIGRFEISDGVGNPYEDPTNPNDDYISGHEPDPGFALFNTDLPGTLNTRMNRWEKGKQPYTKSVDILVDYVDDTEAQTVGLLPPSSDDVPREICPASPEWTQVPDYSQVADEFKTYSFYACVNWEANTAKVYLRGNALARIHSAPNQIEYKESRSSFFPTATVEVKGVGGLSQGGS
ncbi:hormogonium polysaccharide secretion pseudopilin HpsC [Coleofasciculus sp. E2-BRE-01]|uniref:hormogonium polysaccharide secretion pseudopilin HpsC n=1 Tax=Coleofasciculus sp. E2-BRE-01 TaxID=3069524 RepID=UPI0033037BE6